jgi:16S rRNA (guanine527-N7)-methyltransferase
MTSETFDLTDARKALVQAQEYGFFSDQDINVHIEHAKNFVSLCDPLQGKVLDLGAGGGLPSLVWLAINQDVEIRALDAMNKRCNFLREVIDQHPSLKSRFEVLEGRAEELARDETLRHGFTHCIARGFAAPPITAECATGFLSVGGTLTISGRPDNEQERWEAPGLDSLGLKFDEVRSAGQTHVAHLTKIRGELDKFPRRAAAIKKQPLW